MDVTAATAASTQGMYINNCHPSSSSVTSTLAHSSISGPNHLHSQQQAQYQMAKLRRESIAHSQGIGGVSWGSLTIGSWLKDEVMIHAHMKDSSQILNNNHFFQQNSIVTPSFGSPPGSSSAYLPNLEKQYCKDYSCCGQLLPGLHDLLRHYEEAHISTSPGHNHMLHNTGNVSIMNNSSNVTLNQMAPANGAGSIQKRRMMALYQQQFQSQHHQMSHNQQQHLHANNGDNPQLSSTMLQQQITTQQQNISQSALISHHIHNNSQHSQHQQQNGNQAPVNQSQSGNLVDAVSTNEVFLHTGSRRLNSANMVSHTNSNSPASSGSNSNTHSSSFNNYSLQMNKQILSQQSRLLQKRSPNINTASAGVDLDFMDQDIIDDFNQDPAIIGIQTPLTSTPSSSSRNPVSIIHSKKKSSVSITSKKTGTDDDEDELDEENEDEHDDNDISSIQQHQKQQQAYIDDPARRLYVMDHEEHKPFKCPVIGCDKTYKNQNGLKYHKIHGHQNQKLHENPDGTFSIIDPESNEPYPDGMGLEKDKPYRCEVCGKRYKNLNGLKYHRGHSTH